MLTGNDFVIFSDTEARLLYDALKIRKDKATYKDLLKLGILNLVKDLEHFLFKEE